MILLNSFLVYIFLLTAQPVEINNSDICSAYDNLREFTIGPQTGPVKMDGYLETDTYHEMRYVDQKRGSDREGDGSRERPWATIKHALTQITDARLAKRYAVLIAEGTYVESTIHLKEYVSMYGGFEGSTWDRDIRRYKTILNGDGRERVLMGADFSKVDGFEIREGVVRGRGGAILCDGTSPAISNNVFTQNKTLAPVPWDPGFLHEIAHDGAAIAAYNGASPVVENNLFFQNSTEIGRGGGIASHNRASPRIAYNVFIDNVAGTADFRRSSDGGAISAALYSNPDIRHNLIIGNKVLNENDGGGIFSELWSSLIIEGNIIIGNSAADDGGGLFIAGQTHHYVTVVDPVPPSERFLIQIRNNIMMGNSITGEKESIHGVMRSTNDSRLVFDNNLIAESIGGIDFRTSDIEATGNTIFVDIVVRRISPEGEVLLTRDIPARFSNNLIVGDLIEKSEVIKKNTKVLDKKNYSDENLFPELFIDDGKFIEAMNVEFHEDRYVTVIRLKDIKINPNELIYRILRSDDRWGVVKQNDEKSITVWGNFADMRSFTVLPTYTHNKSSYFYNAGIGHR